MIRFRGYIDGFISDAEQFRVRPALDACADAIVKSGGRITGISVQSTPVDVMPLDLSQVVFDDKGEATVKLELTTSGDTIMAMIVKDKPEEKP